MKIDKWTGIKVGIKNHIIIYQDPWCYKYYTKRLVRSRPKFKQKQLEHYINSIKRCQ